MRIDPKPSGRPVSRPPGRLPRGAPGGAATTAASPGALRSRPPADRAAVAHQLRQMGDLVDQRHVPLDHVDDRGDEERTGEHHRDRQDRPGPGRSEHHQEQRHAVGDAERPDVARLVHRRALLPEEGGHRHDEDDHRDQREEGPHQPPPAGPVGDGVEPGHVPRQVGHLLRGSDHRGPTQAGDLVAVAAAPRARLEVGGQQAWVDARVLPVGVRGDRGDPLGTGHVMGVAADGHRVPGHRGNGARIRR
jgi:hypothetical protein